MVVCYIYNDCILYFIVNAAPAPRAPAAAPRAPAPAPRAIRSVRPVSAASVPRDGDSTRAQQDECVSEPEESDDRPSQSTASTQSASRSLSPTRSAASIPRDDDNSNKAKQKGTEGAAVRNDESAEQSSEMTIEPCTPGSTTKRKGGYRPRTPKAAVVTKQTRVAKDNDTPGSKTVQRYKAVKNCELLALLSDQDKNLLRRRFQFLLFRRDGVMHQRGKMSRVLNIALILDSAFFVIHPEAKYEKFRQAVNKVLDSSDR